MRISFLLTLSLIACTRDGPPATDVHQSPVHNVCGQVDGAQGIDVSHHQGAVDWRAIAGDSTDFAFIKATEADGFRDRRFAENWAAARANGVVRGAYHFFRPRVDGRAQADWFLQVVGESGGIRPDDLPAVVDVEVNDGVGRDLLLQRLSDWLSRVEAVTGKRPIIYVSSYFWDDNRFGAAFARYPLWTAHYTRNGLDACPLVPDPWDDWRFWQYTSTGRVAGVDGNVDRNVFNGTLAELRAWANAGGACDRCGNGACAEDRSPGYGELFMTPEGPRVYLAQHGWRHHVRDEACFNLIFGPAAWEDIRCVTVDRGAMRDAPEICSDGAWYRLADDPRAYRLENGRSVPLCGAWTGDLFREQANGMRMVDAIVEVPDHVLDAWPVRRFDADWPPRSGPPTCGGAGLACGRIDDPSGMCHRPIDCGGARRAEACGRCGVQNFECTDGRWASVQGCEDPCAAVCDPGSWAQEDAICQRCAADGGGFDAASRVDDGNPCTRDRCDANRGAVHQDVEEGVPCDDGNPQTRDDACREGRCVGRIAECAVGEWAASGGRCRPCGPDGRWGDGLAIDDNNPCTVDRCDPRSGPAYAPRADGEACDDGQPATLDDSCQRGACVGRAAECEAGRFVAAGGLCRGCVAGRLAPGEVIDDRDPCTHDVCDPRDGLARLPADGFACDDGDAETIGDRCDDGRCVPGAICTAGRWALRAGGCARCSADGARWLAPERLDAGQCEQIGCDPIRGVTRDAAPDGQPCDDGRPTTHDDQCLNGQCVGTAQACVPGQFGWRDGLCRRCSDDGRVWEGGAALDDGDPCTADRCDAEGGVVHTPHSGPQCDDNNPDTVGDRCVVGRCEGQAPECEAGTWRGSGGRCQRCVVGGGWTIGELIDDGDPCTRDVCHAEDGPIHPAQSDGAVCGAARVCRDGACVAEACVGAAEQICGDCGRRTRRCVDGGWTGWSACMGEGVCRPGEVEACAGGNRTCGAQCLWQACQPDGCELDACAVRFGPDGRTVEVDSTAFVLHGGTPLTQLLAEDDLCHIGWAIGEIYNHRQRPVRDANGDGWIEIPLPAMEAGLAPYPGCPDCVRAGLPYRFSLRRCHPDLVALPHYLNAGPPGGPLTGEFYWHGVDDQCNVTGSLAVSWVDGRYVASGLDAGPLSCE